MNRETEKLSIKRFEWIHGWFRSSILPSFFFYLRLSHLRQTRLCFVFVIIVRAQLFSSNILPCFAHSTFVVVHKLFSFDFTKILIGIFNFFFCFLFRSQRFRISKKGSSIKIVDGSITLGFNFGSLTHIFSGVFLFLLSRFHHKTPLTFTLLCVFLCVN